MFSNFLCFQNIQKFKFFVCGSFMFSLIFSANFLNAATILTENEYIKQVEKNNKDIQSINLAYQAIEKKALELDMTYSPYLDSSFTKSGDSSGSSSSSLPIKDINSNVLNMSLIKKYESGSKVNIGYSFINSDINLTKATNIYGSDVTSFSSYQMTPTISFEQSLLRDYKGRITSAGIKKTKATLRANQYSLLSKKQQILVQAKAAYWKLSYCRDVIQFRKASLERTEKILKWNQKKAALNLAEKADVLESSASYSLKNLNLELAIESEITAARTFNQFLGETKDIVDFELEKLKDKKNYYLAIELIKNGERADVLAQKYVLKNSEYADIETKYNAMPELKFLGSYSLSGSGTKFSDSTEQVKDWEKPSYSFGLSLIVPLDYKKLRTIKEGYNHETLSSKKSVESAELSAKNDWENLLKTWKNVKNRLVFSETIRKIQEERVQNEQNLLDKGRTTTFLFLSAQNDFDDATLNVLGIILEEITTYIQMDLYNNSDIGEIK